MENETSILIYQTENGATKIQVRLEEETVWMNQSAIAELYQSTKQNISLHIKNIFNDHELAEDSVVKYYLTTAQDGKKYKTKHYNLEMILAIGYRVRSHRGTQFRQWATERLNEYLVKGFTMDDERLKEMRNFGEDYFDELLERIRDIRAPEKRFYQKITDIYATSVDYAPKAEITQEFFATVQNKLHFAIHGHTAADAKKPMYMKVWAEKLYMNNMKRYDKRRFQRWSYGIARQEFMPFDKRVPQSLFADTTGGERGFIWLPMKSLN